MMHFVNCYVTSLIMIQVKVMAQQLLMFHTAVSAYFSGNQAALEENMEQLAGKVRIFSLDIYFHFNCRSKVLPRHGQSSSKLSHNCFKIFLSFPSFPAFPCHCDMNCCMFSELFITIKRQLFLNLLNLHINLLIPIGTDEDKK